MKLNKNWDKICYSIRPVEETIDEQPKVVRWIPVEEQEEPKENGKYLVSGYWLESGNNQVEEADYFGEWNVVNNFVIEAWMPMPEPYRKEN